MIIGSLSNHDDDGNKNPHKFAYFTMKNSIFARFARAYSFFWHFEDALVLSTTWNDLFCSCVDDVSIWSQMLIFVFLCPKPRWFQFNFRIIRTQFSSIMTFNNWKMIAETRSYIFPSTRIRIFFNLQLFLSGYENIRIHTLCDHSVFMSNSPVQTYSD